MEVFTKCSNYATDTCPCVLAENGKCIECSMCRGEDYCTCSDTVSFCIRQELLNNGGRAKQRHSSMLCEVRYVREYDDVFCLMRVAVPNADDFKKLGAYVFVRVNEDPFFDVPISVLYEDYGGDTICLIINMVGIKTECFRSVREGGRIWLRGPYYNGMQGRSAVGRLHDSRAAVICRGIGFIPSMHVIGTLRENNNAIDVYLDRGRFSRQVMNFFEELQEIRVNEVTVCDENGELTEDFERITAKAGEEGVGLIHLGLSDYLLKKAIGAIEQKYPDHEMPLSCINNSHICCGEGVCGSCTKDAGPDKTVHLCKEQVDLYEYKKII